jgi:hypothetical protein
MQTTRVVARSGRVLLQRRQRCIGAPAIPRHDLALQDLNLSGRGLQLAASPRRVPINPSGIDTKND